MGCGESSEEKARPQPMFMNAGSGGSASGGGVGGRRQSTSRFKRIRERGRSDTNTRTSTSGNGLSGSVLEQYGSSSDLTVHNFSSSALRNSNNSNNSRNNTVGSSSGSASEAPKLNTSAGSHSNSQNGSHSTVGSESLNGSGALFNPLKKPSNVNGNHTGARRQTGGGVNGTPPTPKLQSRSSALPKPQMPPGNANILRQLPISPIQAPDRYLGMAEGDATPHWAPRHETGSAKGLIWCSERPAAVSATDMARMVRDNPDRKWSAHDSLGRLIVDKLCFGDWPDTDDGERWVIVLDHSCPALVYWVGKDISPPTPEHAATASLVNLCPAPAVETLYSHLIASPNIILIDAMAMSDSRETSESRGSSNFWASEDAIVGDALFSKLE